MGRVGDVVEEVGHFALFAWRTLLAAVVPTHRPGAFVEQMHRQGVRALWLATVASLFYGMVLALQLALGLDRFDATALLPEATTVGLFRDLVPTLVGLVVGTRLCAGVAAELGSMAVTQQIDAVSVLGADPIRELYAPRVTAAVIVMPLMTVYADLVAVLGAMITADSEYRIGPRFYVAQSRRFVLIGDFTIGLVKAATFGLTIALLACWHGSRTRGGSDEVGHATTRAVVHGALAVILLDFAVSRLWNL